MEDSYALGEDFARWVELTDDYGLRIAHLWDEETPNLGKLAEMARRLQQLSQAADVRDWSAAPHP
jgi:hypothetical protein